MLTPIDLLEHSDHRICMKGWKRVEVLTQVEEDLPFQPYIMISSRFGSVSDVPFGKSRHGAHPDDDDARSSGQGNHMKSSIINPRRGRELSVPPVHLPRGRIISAKTAGLRVEPVRGIVIL